MNIYLQQIQEYLKKEEIRTTFEEKEQRFETVYSGSHIDVHSRVCYVEENQKLEHLVFLDVKIPQEKEAEICTLLNIINDCLNVGHFLLTKQWYVICVTRFCTNGDAVLTQEQLERLWRTPLNMVLDFEKTIMQVAFGDIDAHTAIDRFWEEREAAQKAAIKTNKPSIRETIRKWVKGISKN